MRGVASSLAKAAALAALAPLVFASGARAQASPASAATPAPAGDPQAQDRVFALVQAGKCAQAKAAAEQENDADLADQIGRMCGLQPAAAGAGGGGHRGSGGGRGGGGGAGRRGGL